MKYTPQQHGAADYNKYIMVPNTYWDSTTQETSAIDPFRQGKYAMMVHVVNPSSSGGGGGGGPIQDGESESILATVQSLTNSNPLASMIVDANGDQITTFGGGNSGIADGVTNSIVATVADLTNSNPLASMIVDASGNQITSFGATLVAETGTPTAVADGEDVDLWVDELGRQVMFGANVGLNALDVNVINDAGLARLGPVTNLNAVSANSDGDTIDVSLYHNITIHTISTGVTTGAVVTLQHSLDNSNWVDLDANTITGNESTELTYSGAYKYIRTIVSNWTDGAFTTKFYAGN